MRARVVAPIDSLLEKFTSRTARVAVVGLGYVGLPLAKALIEAGFRVFGLDVDPEKIVALRERRNYIRHLPSDLFKGPISSGQFIPTTDFDNLTEVDATLICVPTPLTKNREPDLTFVVGTTKEIAQRLRPGQLIILESTTYPGTTREVMKPIFEAGGLQSSARFLPSV